MLGLATSRGVAKVVREAVEARDGAFDHLAWAWVRESECKNSRVLRVEGRVVRDGRVRR